MMTISASVLRCFRSCLWLGLFLALQTAVPAQEKASSAGELMDKLATGASLWEATPDALEKAFAGPVQPQWLDAEHTRARFGGEVMSLAGGKIPVVEANAEFAGGKLARVNFSIYNRGDSGRLRKTKKEFEETIADYSKTITEMSGSQPVERRAASGPTGNAVKTKGIMWTGKTTAYLLEYSTDKEAADFSVEFVRLRLVPIGAGVPLGNNASRGPATATRDSLMVNVKKEDNGDIYLVNVPMVDQGEKGYCVVATLERVLKYYGLTVDQHEMAQLAGSSSAGGTSYRSMMTALDDVKGKLRLGVKDLQHLEMKELVDLAKDYNRIAKRAKKPLLPEEPAALVNVQEVYEMMDAETLKQAKTGGNEYTKFQKTIKDFVEKGVPLIWAVELGKYEEPKITPQMRGGHMRMIIGINEKTKELLFSDSWGAEHAMKRMPIDNGFAMTQGLFALEPRR